MASQDWIYDPEYALAEKFEEETGIKIDFQIVPADQYSNLLLTKLNTGECTDLFGNHSGKFDLVSQLNIEKNAVDLSDEPWVERFDEFSAAELTVNGKLYGVTIYDNTTDFYVVYNKKIFEKLGLEEPTTYEQFKKVCEKIKNAGIIPVYECVAEGWHHVMWFCEIGERYNEINPGVIEQLNNNETTFAEAPSFAENLNQIARDGGTRLLGRQLYVEYICRPAQRHE
ncbi:MAG: ABC transporter substrate-binding protein [Acetivibrionales bacterium]